MPDVDGSRVLGLYCHIADISAHRLPETPAATHTAVPTDLGERLSDGELRLRLMLDGLRDHAVYFLDTEGRVSEWTSSAERLLGYAAADILGSDARGFDAPDVREDERLDNELALERAALFGQFESTGWRQRQDGSRFWGHTVLTALREAGTGRPLGFSALTRDMTEVRRLQELLQDLNQTLEVRVQERTRQLLEANRDLESFSSSVSHDLRAPLRHITSFIAILQEHLGEQADATTTKHLHTIADAAQRMGALIEGLLAFSRRQELDVRAVDVEELIHGMLELVRRSLDANTATGCAPENSDCRTLQSRAALSASPGSRHRITWPRSKPMMALL